MEKENITILTKVVIFLLRFPNNQNVQMGGTVSTVANNAQNIVETLLNVITLQGNVMKGVVQDGQGLSVPKVNERYQVRYFGRKT